MSFLEFITAQQAEILKQTGEHVGLTLTALSIAILIGLPIGILLTRYRRFSSSALGAVGIIQTIPSVALLGFLLPLLGIGVVPAIVALFLYALLPIVRNTFTGIDEVDPAVREAARGMGMSDRQILFKVELPLSVPVIFAGIRTATVINVGIATLCALIGSGGLGEFIFRGIALNNVYMILAGAIPAAILALLFDAVVGLLQRHIRRLIKPILVLAGVIIFVIIPFIVLPSFFSQPFTAGFTSEFMERSDGYQGLREHYGLSLNTVELDPGLMYQALKEKKVDVICGFSTDGRIQAYNLRVLEDDRSYFPPYQAAPLVRGETLRRYPVLEEIFSQLAGRLTNEKMTRLNYLVDHRKRDPRDVADEFLRQAGFTVSQGAGGPADIRIGSKNFTEQYILAHLFETLIESRSDLEVDLKTGLAGTKICLDALTAGEIDLYPEYTGTGLHVILKAGEELDEETLRDRDQVYRFVKEQSSRRFDLHWLPPLGFNNTYALMMRQEQAERLKIETITDLKEHLEARRTPVEAAGR
jgi:osmoprotectant transport system permease protein